MIANIVAVALFLRWSRNAPLKLYKPKFRSLILTDSDPRTIAAQFLDTTRVADTYWYLEAVPELMRDIAERAEQFAMGSQL